MNLHVLRSVEAKARGVIGRDGLDPNDLYMFLDTFEGAGFHMRGVPFNISIAFLDRDMGILAIQKMEAETGTATAPFLSSMAVEAHEDYFDRKGFKVNDVWKELWTREQQGEFSYDANLRI